MDELKAIEIKVSLLRLGIKQADIARKMNVTRISVHDVIHGKRTSRRIMGYIEALIKSEESHAQATHH
jgi:predicted XRE-type DNA-binding protein